MVVQTDRKTERQTDKVSYRGALLLKRGKDRGKTKGKQRKDKTYELERMDGQRKIETDNESIKVGSKS